MPPPSPSRFYCSLRKLCYMYVHNILMSTAPSVENWFAHLSAERNQSSQKYQRRKTRMSHRKCYPIHLRCCVLVHYTWTCISYINMHAYIMFTLICRGTTHERFFFWLDGVFPMPDKYPCIVFSGWTKIKFWETCRQALMISRKINYNFL